MSELLGFKVGIHEIPPALSKYIREKASSQFSKLYFIPVVFPVFVMNPYQYSENFAGVLSERYTATAKSVGSDPVPNGEIWEIRHAAMVTTASAGTIFLRICQNSSVKHTITQLASGQFHEWDGFFLMEEDEFLRASFANSGSIQFDVLGVKRYA